MTENGFSGQQMEYKEFAQDQLHRPLSFASVEECEAALQRVGATSNALRQLDSGHWQSHWVVHEKGDTKLTSGRYARAFSAQLHPPGKDTVTLLLFVTAGGRLMASGKAVGDDALLILPAATDVDIVTPPLSGAESITLSQTRFQEIAATAAPDVRLNGAAIHFTGCATNQQTLRRAVRQLIAHPEWDPVDEQLSDLLTAATGWMAAAKGDETRPSRTLTAKHAQSYIEDNYRNAVRIEDVCRETGVGVRTLQRSFRQYFGLTIRQYLKTVRLDAAYRALIRGNCDSVADVALQQGLGHLGRFSGDFRRRFGESPKQTLRRGARSATQI